VARSIADGMSLDGAIVDLTQVAEAPADLSNVNLLIVGGPTHAFGMTRPKTRRAAIEQGARGGVETGVREWLEALQSPKMAIEAACFDTRIRKPFVVGSAARAIRRRLRRLGMTVAPAMSFTVTGTPGPLAPDELERAREWGRALLDPVRTPARR
jgi:hypothetical protein